MKVLQITPELPYEPGGGGGRTRENLLSRQLVERGHEVLNISPVSIEEVGRVDGLTSAGIGVRGAIRPGSHPQEALRGLLRNPALAWYAVVEPVSALMMRVFWTRLGPLVDEAIASWRPDVVLVGHDMAMSWADRLPGSLPRVVTLHNLNWRLYESQATRAAAFRRVVLQAEAARYRRYVVSRLPNFDCAVTVSTVEDDLVSTLGMCHSAWIPTGVDLSLVRPQHEASDSSNVLFPGSFDYAPNIEGAVWFVGEVWPLIRANVPGANLRIVGRNPHESVQALNRLPDVEVIPNVPSMAPYFAAASVVVAPILSGAGMRVKVVESLASGRATISTPLGAEGLGLADGQEVIIEQESESFARAVSRALEHPQERRALAERGRAAAERDFDWRVLGEKLERELELAIERRAAPGGQNGG